MSAVQLCPAAIAKHRITQTFWLKALCPDRAAQCRWQSRYQYRFISVYLVTLSPYHKELHLHKVRPWGQQWLWQQRRSAPAKRSRIEGQAVLLLFKYTCSSGMIYIYIYMNVYDSCDPILIQNFPSIRVEQWKGGSTLPAGIKTSWIMPCLHPMPTC